ncbi:MAG: hemerythrin domain-containing protein [Hyphomicrobiaceae bacterium]|nr:hemerythrin domain-containing protein [Hyphomicrobiaceae bacterium]
MSESGRQRELEPDGLLAFIEEEHSREQVLCNQLERIADDLLDPLDPFLTKDSVVGLRKHTRRHLVLEEVFLYPVLTKRLREGELEPGLVAQIRGEHASDECLAYDTADQLEKALEHGRAENPEMLGYMLHGFFECRRRHIAWEDAVVLPLARSRLLPNDFRAFSIEEFEEALAGGKLRAAKH